MTVRGIAAGGSGVADLPDGRVVFVPRTAPGDRAAIAIVRSKPRWAMASLEAIIEPARERCPPPCTLYDECGGCQLQHLPYERQLEWKGRIVRDALERIGRCEAVGVPEVVPSPRRTGYRNRMTFTLRRLRGGHTVAGFHGLHRPAHVVDVHAECVLPAAPIQEAWLALRAAWGPAARLLPKGGRLRLTLSEEASGVSLLVEGGGPDWSAEALAAAVPALGAIWHSPDSSGSEPRWLAASPHDAEMPRFRQVNTEAAALLVAHVAEVAGTGRTGRVAVDAYCGSGEFGRRLAEAGWTVAGIDSDAAACAAARRAAGPGVTVLEGTVEDRMDEALPADLLIVNPPRVGLHVEVVRSILAQPVPRLIYVSCDPATLARDVSKLGSGYTLGGVRCFDLFPQTAHVETVLAMTAREPAE